MVRKSGKRGSTKRPRSSQTTSSKSKRPNSSTRLNKYIANAGICSRREADVLIEQGKVKVNDRVVTTLGYQVKPGDRVKYQNQVLRPEPLVYVLLNKPKDYITTTHDPEQRKTVMQLVSKACKERIFPVGRLDRNTTGLLLLTNDGDLSKKLTHPSHQVMKVYHVKLENPLSKADYHKILEGIQLDDGPVNVDQLEFVSADKTELGIELHSGRNRLIRRIFEQLGYEVVKLDRVIFAGLTKKDLPRGKWRRLSQRELIRLKHLDKGAPGPAHKKKKPQK